MLAPLEEADSRAVLQAVLCRFVKGEMTFVTGKGIATMEKSGG